MHRLFFVHEVKGGHGVKEDERGKGGGEYFPFYFRFDE